MTRHRFGRNRVRLRGKSSWRAVAAALAAGLSLAGCGDSGGETPAQAPTPTPTPTPTPPPAPSATPEEASRFLSQTTFGPTSADIDLVADIGLSEWMLEEFDKPPTLHLQGVLAQIPGGDFVDDDGEPLIDQGFLSSHSFWEAAIDGEDQLRQRMAYALSQILVVSTSDFELFILPQTTAAYMDILTEGAFGNYRDLLEEVTYSVAMAEFLTYLANPKGDMATGRVPDENYARELMQLFTIGLVELNPDGTPRLDGDGNPIETYDNMDVTGLARVFTGLNLDDDTFFTNYFDAPRASLYAPLKIYPLFHSELEKSFLDVTIPPNTGAAASIDQALDTLFNHPNMAPFLSRQLIQRFVTSDPDPAYVARVADAFEMGAFALPNGAVVGEGERGDLKATLAAILFDDEARNPASGDDPEFGKLREPVIRFTHWARAFKINSADPSNEVFLFDTASPSLLAQHPYRAPSVFNFYRPGYVAPGTSTGAAGLTAPELQIVNASSIVGYTNFLTLFIVDAAPNVSDTGPQAFIPDYATEFALAEDPAALVEHLDLLLTYGEMQDDTKTRIIDP
ncbi:MAG: DUF1800 family protein [Pseudomonadota bacterium]